MSYDDIERVVGMLANFLGSASIASNIGMPMGNNGICANNNKFCSPTSQYTVVNNNNNGVNMVMPPMPMGMGMGIPFNGMNFNYNYYNGMNMQPMPMNSRMDHNITIDTRRQNANSNTNERQRPRQRQGAHGYYGRYSNATGYDNDGDDADDESDDAIDSRKAGKAKKGKKEKIVEFDFGNMINVSTNGFGYNSNNNYNNKYNSRTKSTSIAKYGVNRQYNDANATDDDDDDDDDDVVVKFNVQYNPKSVIQKVYKNRITKNKIPKIHFSDGEDVDILMNEIFDNYRDSDIDDNDSDYHDNELDFDFEGDLIRFSNDINIDKYESEEEFIQDEDRDDDNDDEDDDDEFTTLYRGRFTLPITFDEYGEFIKYKIALRGGEITDEEDSDEEYDDDEIDRPDGTMMIIIDDDKEIEINRYRDTIISPNKYDNARLHRRKYKSAKNQHKNVNRNTNNKVRLPSYDEEQDFDYISNNVITIDLPSDTFQVDTMFARLVDEDGNYILGCDWYAIEMTSLAGKRMRNATKEGKEPKIFCEDCDPELKEELLTSLEHIGNMYKHVDLIAPLDEDISIETYDPSFSDYDEFHEDDETDDESDVEDNNDGDIPIAHNKNRLFKDEIKIAQKTIIAKKQLQLQVAKKIAPKQNYGHGINGATPTFELPYYFNQNNKVVIGGPHGNHLRVSPYNTAFPDGKGAQRPFGHWNVILHKNHTIQLQSALTGKYLRMYEDGDKIDVLGTNGPFTYFRYHIINKQQPNVVRLSSTQYPTRFIAITPDFKVASGFGGEHCTLTFLQQTEFGTANYIETMQMAGKAGPQMQQKFGDRIKRAAKKIGKAVKKLGHSVGKGLKKAGQKIKTGFKNAGKAIGTAAKAVGTRIDKAITAVANTPFGKKLKLDKAYENIKKGFVHFGTKVAKGFKKVFKAVVSFVKAGIGFIKNAVKKLVEFLGKIFNFGNIVQLAKNIKYVMINGMNRIIFNNVNVAAIFLKKHLVGNLDRVVNLLKTDEVEDLTETPEWAVKLGTIIKKGAGFLKKGVSFVSDKIISPVKDAIGKIIKKIMDKLNFFNQPKMMEYIKDAGSDFMSSLFERAKNVLNTLLNGITIVFKMVIDFDFNFRKMIKLVSNVLAGVLAEIIGVLSDTIEFFLEILSKLQFEDMFPTLKDNFIRKFLLFIMGQNAKVPGSEQGKKDVGMLDILSFVMAFGVTFVNLITFNDKLSQVFNDRAQIDGLMDDISGVFGQDIDSDDSNDDSKEAQFDSYDNDNVETFGQAGGKPIKTTQATNGLKTSLNRRRISAYAIKALSSIIAARLSLGVHEYGRRTIQEVAASHRSETKRWSPGLFTPLTGGFLNLLALMVNTDYTDIQWFFYVSLVTCILNMIILMIQVIGNTFSSRVGQIFDKACKALNWLVIIIRNAVLMVVNFKIAFADADLRRQRFQNSAVAILSLFRILQALCDYGALFGKGNIEAYARAAGVILGATQTVLWVVLMFHAKASENILSIVE